MSDGIGDGWSCAARTATRRRASVGSSTRAGPTAIPAAVLEALDADDVVAGVRLARERGWKVSVRSGGHSLGGLEPARRRAADRPRQPCATWRTTRRPASSPPVRPRQGALELAPFLTERGRAFPGGHCAGVGIGGFLLQGGQGWNGRRKGWACESVVAVDVVTADGDLVRADAEQQRRPLLGRARCRSRLPRHRHPLPPADLPEAGRDVAGHLDASTSTTPSRSCTGCTRCCPTLDRRVEPVLAATRLPDVPLYDGVEHPGGTVLLLHTTVHGRLRRRGAAAARRSAASARCSAASSAT